MQSSIVLLYVICVIALCGLSHAFVSIGRVQQSMSSLQMKGSGGYRKMLKKAKAKGPKKQGAEATPAATTTAVAPASTQAALGEKQPWESNTDGLSVKAKQEFKNKVPFSKDMYETIKTAVNLLSARSSADKTLLTSEEADWFSDAVEAILEDANMYGPPKPAARVEISAEDRAAME